MEKRHSKQLDGLYTILYHHSPAKKETLPKMIHFAPIWRKQNAADTHTHTVHTSTKDAILRYGFFDVVVRILLQPYMVHTQEEQGWHGHTRMLLQALGSAVLQYLRDGQHFSRSKSQGWVVEQTAHLDRSRFHLRCLLRVLQLLQWLWKGLKGIVSFRMYWRSAHAAVFQARTGLG